MKTTFGEIKNTKHIRKCSVTGEIIQKGWVIHKFQLLYASTEEIALKLVKDLGYTSIQEAYEDEVCYYTEWEE